MLVHRGFVDRSGWQGVYDALRADGCNVAIVQNPTISLEGGVATTYRVTDALPGPATLVGHSYGGGRDHRSGQRRESGLAWSTKPSWYLVASGDRMIPPPTQRAMAERIGARTVEVPGSHSVFVSRPSAVVDLIKQATCG